MTANDPIFKNKILHDIQSYQHSIVDGHSVVILGERHVPPRPLPIGVQEPLEIVRHTDGLSIVLSAEISPLSFVRSRHGTDSFLKTLPPHIQPIAYPHILEEIDRNEMSQNIRLERLTYQYVNGMWPRHVKFNTPNSRDLVPYILLEWLGPHAKDVTDTFISMALLQGIVIAKEEWEAARELFYKDFLKHVTSVRKLKQLYISLYFKGIVPEWFTRPLEKIKNASSNPFHDRIKTASPAIQKQVRGFFDRWLMQSIKGNEMDKILEYLKNRQFLSVDEVIQKYPAIPTFISYMHEVVMDLEIIIHDSNIPPGSIHVIYVGDRHAHRLGAFWGGKDSKDSKDSKARSWTEKTGWVDCALNYSIDGDVKMIREQVTMQLAMPGGSRRLKDLKDFRYWLKNNPKAFAQAYIRPISFKF